MKLAKAQLSYLFSRGATSKCLHLTEIRPECVHNKVMEFLNLINGMTLVIPVDSFGSVSRNMDYELTI